MKESQIETGIVAFSSPSQFLPHSTGQHDTHIPETMASPALNRNSSGQFTSSNPLKRSFISEIIDEELDKFWESTRNRLNAIDQTTLPEEMALQVQNAQSDLRRAISTHFGDPVARSCVTVHRRKNGWNRFSRDGYKRIREQMLAAGGFPGCSYGIDVL